MRLLRALTWIGFVGPIFTSTSLAQVGVATSIPSEVKSGQSFLVELTVSKGNVSGFGKLELDVPEGYVAEQVEINGSSFGTSGSKVKFVWMAMPEDTVFAVTYKLKPLGNVKGVLMIGGRIIYAYNGEPRKHVISPKPVAVGVGLDVVESLLAMPHDSALSGFIAESSITSKRAGQERGIQNIDSNQGDGQPKASGRQELTDRSSSSPEKNDSGASMPGTLSSKADSRSSKASSQSGIDSDHTQGNNFKHSNRGSVQYPAKGGNPGLDNIGVLPIAGVTFRVQVAALTTQKRTPEEVMGIYDIPDILMIESEGGATKFLTSQVFTLYRAAKTKANELREITSAPGPFVVSYLEGERVHIAQALSRVSP